MTEGFIHVSDGVELFYRASGSGPVALVPNGFHLEGLLQGLGLDRTLVFYDVRNRGRSTAIDSGALLARGIHNDVDDLEIVRRHFRAARGDLIGHSYVGVIVMLYALQHPETVGRIALIGPMGPAPSRRYEPPLSYDDGTMSSVMSRLSALEPERPRRSPEDFCRMAWAILGELYVTNPADAPRADWGRCDLPNERAGMQYWTKYLLPSLTALTLTAADLRTAKAPVLIVHGRKDRSAPYGGGRDWACSLTNARLATIDEGGHAPWIEDPDRVASELRSFLGAERP